MRNAFLDTAEDMQWLRETHLKGVPLPTDWQGFASAFLRGNEDCPESLELFRDSAPNYTDDFLRVTFNHGAPIYCEYAVIDGQTQMPREG